MGVDVGDEVYVDVEAATPIVARADGVPTER
jgi:hypothetical protein